MTLTVGSLCSGYGGLELGLAQVLNIEVAWHCEVDRDASRVLDVRFPGVPNHGDLTKVDWTQVEPVDVMAFGFPCQDLSYAGKGAGIVEGTRSGLWYAIADVVGVLRPRYIVAENVAAIVARRPGLDVVLADLAALGLDAVWTCLRASDVGAPHRRDRWFMVASDATAADAAGEHGERPVAKRNWTRATRTADADVTGPQGAEPAGRRQPPRGAAPDTAQPEQGEPQQPGVGTPAGRATEPGERLGEVAWGPYAPAIERWERVLGRPAPAPTDGRNLNPVFVEWMQGLPEGHVSDVLPRRPALKCLGNGVVPQQAAAALTHLLAPLAVAT